MGGFLFWGKIMRKLERTFIPLTEAMKRYNFTKRQLYDHVSKGEWRDGFVIKRGAGSTHWKFFCVEDWEQWQGITNYQVA